MKEKILPKAYAISSDYAEHSEVVWAETSGKAKRIALDMCESMWDFDFVKLRARRLPKMDMLYKGEPVADWCDEEVRNKLVYEYGWHCAEPDLRDCKICSAREFCETWEDMKDDIDGEVSG